MNGNKPTVLIVEDEVIYAMLLKRQLIKNGFDVCCNVVSGEEAIDSANKFHPDCVLMDIHLAGVMDGIDTAEKVLADITTEIIFMSGYAVDEVKEQAMKIHPLAFLEKPVNVDNLIDMLNNKSND